MNWAEKYRPTTLSSVAGNPTAKKHLLEWAMSWEQGRPISRAVLCCGRAGVGKTSAVLALASEMGWEVVELNASDQRTAEVIRRVVGLASRTATLDPKLGRRLIVLDEADNVHGRADAGGAGAIARAIRETAQPVALIANDCQAVPTSISSQCLRIQFKKPSTKAVLEVLRRVCAAEGIRADLEVIERIAEAADGDIRGAINDLQALTEGRKSITLDDLHMGTRDVKSDVFKVLNLVFKGSDLRAAQDAAFTIDQSPDDLIHWIDENLPDAYAHPDEIARAYHWLSRADVFLGRVRRRQDYGMWRYASVDMLGGVMVAKRSPPHPKRYRSPTYWRLLGRLKRMREMRDRLAHKIGRYTHTSGSYVKRELLPFFRLLCASDGMAVVVCELLELTLDETTYLLDGDASRAERVYTEATRRRRQHTEEVIEYFAGMAPAEHAPEGGTPVSKAERRLSQDDEPKGQKSLFEF